LATNPNVGATLVVGIDRKSVDAVAKAIGDRADRPLEVITPRRGMLRLLALTAVGIRRCARLVRAASACLREPLPLSELYLGMECGHSDATSGLTSNPLVGAVADRFPGSSSRTHAGMRSAFATLSTTTMVGFRIPGLLPLI
jgi:altronate dehydratase large subunit